MTVAGVMSGTSADGINVALVRIGRGELADRQKIAVPTHGGGRTRPDRSRNEYQPHIIKLLGHAEYSYPAKVRAAVLAAMNATRVSVADLSRLNFLLGELYADAILSTQQQFLVRAELVGCHGQTLYHQGEAQQYFGRQIAATWQTGEAAIVAARVGIPVVSDFRPADMAAGGKGAPLVPYLDYLLFRDAKVGRIVQNIGGIANLTAIPAGAAPRDVIAFDTGPGNMVIDEVTYGLFGKSFDRGGRIAASGKVIDSVLAQSLVKKFFRTKPPKTAGREEFGREFVGEFVRAFGRARKQDVIATATALTARSIAVAIRRFVLSGRTKNKNFREMILSGGGVRNATLVGMLAECLSPLSIQLRFSDEFGVPSESKEAVAFAVLAYETWRRQPSNLPSATGAKRTAILGKICYV